MYLRPLVIAVSLLCPAGVGAQTAADEAALRELAARWEQAWNARDATALSALFADDAIFISVRGPEGMGREREGFRASHAEMFVSAFRESRWSNGPVGIRFLSPDVAVMTVEWSTTGDRVRHLPPGTPRRGVFGWTAKRSNGRWEIAQAQNTEAAPIPSGQ
jgi:uncharacterized protein (TIGR02246 family)